uniref:Uncharacterized protein n=1 Tax=Globodera rostochiensis TaxID=31243 RepID=A0A914HGT1_GLORO
MADHPQAVDGLNRKFFYDIFYDGVIRFVDCATLGLKVALISDRFDELVDRYLPTRQWSLGVLEICSPQNDGEGAKVKKWLNDWDSVVLPIPEKPFPDNVTGFRHFIVSYFDDRVCNFFILIMPILKQQLKFDFWATETHEIWEAMPLTMAPLLLNCDSIRLDREELAKLLRVLSPEHLELLMRSPNLRQLVFNGFDDQLLLGSTQQALLGWLHTPMEGGQPPKVLKLIEWGHDRTRNAIDKLKAKFHEGGTSSAVKFIVCFTLSSADLKKVAEFEESNQMSRELLTFERFPCDADKTSTDVQEQQQQHLRLLVQCPQNEKDSQQWILEWLLTFVHFFDADKQQLYHCLLVRCPQNEKDSQQWMEWKREATEEYGQNGQLVSLNVKATEIDEQNVRELSRRFLQMDVEDDFPLD